MLYIQPIARLINHILLSLIPCLEWDRFSIVPSLVIIPCNSLKLCYMHWLSYSLKVGFASVIFYLWHPILYNSPINYLFFPNTKKHIWYTFNICVFSSKSVTLWNKIRVCMSFIQYFEQHATNYGRYWSIMFDIYVYN